MINQDESRATTRPWLARTSFWIVASVATGMLAIAAAHAPPRLKLIGLYTIALGAMSGTVISLLGTRFDVGRRSVIVAAVTLIPIVLLLYAAESFRVWKDARIAHVLAQPGGATIVDQLKTGVAPANPAETELLKAYRPLVEPNPSMYVVERLQGFAPNVSQTTATVVAFSELIAGIVAGVVTAIFLSVPRRSTASEVEE